MQTNAAAIKMIELVKVSLNLLLSLVNDMVDLKLIKANQFTVNMNIFSPLESIRFVTEIFDHDAQGKRLQLTIKTVQGGLLRNINCNKRFRQLQDYALPDLL